MNRKELHKKAMQVTGPLLKEKGYISFVDVFMKLGYLNPKDYEDWRRKRIPYLEKVIKINLGRITFIMKAIRKNCLNGKLKPSWTAYKSWGKGRKIDLRFSKSGDGNVERFYATHYVKTEKKRPGTVSDGESKKEKHVDKPMGPADLAEADTEQR